MSRARTARWLGLVAILGVILACTASAGEPAADLPPEELTAVVPAGQSSSAVAESAPEPAAGTPMLWMDGSTLVYVPAGEFSMGADGIDNPQHSVSLSGFWIHRGEVTNRQYQTCVSLGQCTTPMDSQGAAALSQSELSERPVTGVDWAQAQTYCAWVQGHLPTEAQWELTGRGTTGERFPWGDENPACDLSNFSGCEGALTSVGTHPAGQSVYTVHDMAGNALEWVQDWYALDYYSTSPAQDPPGPESGTQRVTRSSSYLSFPSDLELSRRQYLEPEQFRADLSFRCVVDEPRMLPPFCQMSPIAHGGGSDPQCAPPEVEVGEPYCSQKASYANVYYEAVAGMPATSVGALCDFAGTAPDGRVIVTCGPGSGSSTYKVCEPCETSNTSALGCSLNYVRDPEGNCVPEYGEAPAGGCPKGWDVTSYGCAKPSTIVAFSDCPPGTYYTLKLPGCVSNSALDPGACQPGFVFDPQGGCCAVPAGAKFAGCGADAVMNEDGFCVAPPDATPKSCTEVTITYKVCGGGGGPPGGCTLVCPIPGEFPNETCTGCVKP